VGEANENCSQSHPHLKVHHLHLAPAVPACILAGGVCGGELSRRGRLERRSNDVGEHVREQENMYANRRMCERQDIRERESSWQPA